MVRVAMDGRPRPVSPPDAVRTLIETVSLIACAACARTPAALHLAPDSYLVGRRFVGQLDGTSTRQARLISTPGNYEYALHDVSTARGNRLLMTRLLGRDATNRPSYEILAAVSVPPLRRDELLVLSVCKLNGVRDVDIVAIARRQDRAELGRIRAAWRATGWQATLEQLPVEGIACEYEGWHVR